MTESTEGQAPSDDKEPEATSEEGAKDESEAAPAEETEAAPAEEPEAAKEESPEEVISKAAELQTQGAEDHYTPGTVALTFIFLLCFAIYYFANWKALADVWHVR